MRPAPLAAALLALAAAAAAAPAAAGDRRVEPATPLGVLATLPVKEVTVFKDGHAFVVHGGRMPVAPSGDVLLDDLPSPVLGTFWPFCSDPRATLRGVVAGSRRVLVPRTALDVPSLVRANPGAEVWITDARGERFPATLLGVPERTTEELARTTPPGADLPPPAAASVVLVRTAEGTRVLPLASIADLVFRGEPRKELAGEERRDVLSLRLDWEGGSPAETAEVGMGYLQKGLRWIPSYRVEIDGAGRAVVRLQATLINELADLEGVTANLVIGVPSFDFRETPDPIGLQSALARLSPWFRTDASALSHRAIGSNFVATQQIARAGEYRAPEEGGGEGVPGGPDGGKSEDLFVFTVKGLSLRKGERMVLPVAEAAVPYRDAWTLDLPFSPPPEVRRGGDDGRTSDLLRLLTAPKVAHKLRIENTGAAPFTTAPALVLRDGRPLGQGTMTYTARGGSVDLDVTAAVDVKARKSDRETGRVPDALRWSGNEYLRVDLEGSVSLTNALDRAVEVEVTRWVLGAVDGADREGKAEAVGLHEDGEWTTWRPSWWSWYSWPSWWAHLNGVGRISWTVKVEPGKTESVGYKWHYFWR